MSEISLIQQIKQVQVLKDYINLCVYEMENLNSEMSRWLSYLRESGLTKEFADQFEDHLYMGTVYAMLKDLTERMKEDDYRYLDEVQNKLEDALK